MELFSTEEVNTGRQWAFDFTKFIAIVSMVVVHTFIYIYGEDSDDAFYYLTPIDVLICIAGTLLVSSVGHFIMPPEHKVLFDEVR